MSDNLIKKGFMFGIFIIIAISILSMACRSVYHINSNNIIYVDDSGGSEYTNIQDAIDAAEIDNSIDTIYVYNGIYNEDLKINKIETLTIIGQSREETIIKGTYIGDVVFINSLSADIRLINFSIKNGRDDNYAAIHTLGRNVQISNCDITDNFGKGILTYELNSDYDCIGLKITDCNIFNNKDHAIDIVSNNITSLNISNCNIFNNTRSGIYCHSMDPTGNDLNNLILNSNVTFNQQFGIDIWQCDSFTIIDCNCSNNPNDPGINIKDASNIKIFDCEILSNGDSGIYITNSNNNIFDNCTIEKNAREGILLMTDNDSKTSNNNNIINCTIKANSWDGIRLKDNSRNNEIKSCIIIDNEEKGIEIIDNSNRNTIYDCMIEDNSEGGIQITGKSSGNIITDCVIEKNGDNQYCIEITKDNGLVGPRDNYIYSNVINCSKEEYTAYDSEGYSLNKWDNGSIGNFWYWHAKDGTDEYPEDGIIDFPYPIKGGGIIENEDRFPIKYDPRIPDPLAPEVSIIYPNGGEQLMGTITIRWNAEDVEPDWELYKKNHISSNWENISIDLYYYNESKEDWDPIALNLNKTEEYLWNTKNVSDGMNYRIRIDARDESNNTGSDISSYPFVINNEGPYVSNVRITDTTIDSLYYVKNGDDIEIMADIIFDGPSEEDVYIYADVPKLGIWEEPPDIPPGDGVTAVWNIPNDLVDFKDYNGPINVTVTARNKGTNVTSRNGGSIIVDNTDPTVFINKPKAGVYILNRENRVISILSKVVNPILPNVFQDLSLVIGQVTVNATVMDSNGISAIKWYLDGKQQDFGLEWSLDSSYKSNILKIHRIKIIAYDNARNREYDDITVLKFF